MTPPRLQNLPLGRLPKETGLSPAFSGGCVRPRRAAYTRCKDGQPIQEGCLMARNLVFGVLVAAAVMGCATSSQKSPADSRAAQNSLQSASAAVDRHCAHDTGTRIKQPPDKCVTQ